MRYVYQDMSGSGGMLGQLLLCKLVCFAYFHAVTGRKSQRCSVCSLQHPIALVGPDYAALVALPNLPLQSPYPKFNVWKFQSCICFSWLVLSTLSRFV
jgi:hypothetical protein